MIEWTRLSGEQVEELVAILICRKYPSAIRIRPSSGDGGIDLLLPASDGGSDVYQVKKFASNLSASQKSQIDGSLRRLEQHRVDHSLAVIAWHLVLPLDPTNENLRWFNDATKDLPYPTDWRGLSFIDGLAAEFPDVVDYYVGDGRKRLEAVVGQLTSAMGLKPNGGDGLVSPAQLSDYLESIAPVLDTDPHFRYEVSVGPMKPFLVSEPNMVFATIASAGPDNSSAVTVRVFPRFDAALDFRPIPIEVVIHAGPGSELQRELASFAKYGTSVSAPVGAVEVKMDLPGGLGSDSSNAGLRIISADSLQASRPSHVLRMVALDPDDEILATVLVDMQPATFGLDGTGARTTGTERSGTFRVEMRSDLAAQILDMTVSGIGVEGLVPHEVVAALRFLTALRSPNRIAIAAARGPVGQAMELPNDFGVPDSAFLHTLAGVAASLAAIQEHTTTQIFMPDSISAADAASWRAAEQLLLGEEVGVTTRGVRTCLHPGTAAPEGKVAIVYYSEFSVTIADKEFPIGTVLTHCPIAEVDPASVAPHEDHIDCSFRPVGGATITARLATAE